MLSKRYEKLLVFGALVAKLDKVIDSFIVHYFESPVDYIALC